MQYWFGCGIWFVMGLVLGFAMKVIIKRDETPGHTPILLVLSVLAAVIGGMLGVGIFDFYRHQAISWGGMGGALVFSTAMAWVYRWGVRGLV